MINELRNKRNQVARLKTRYENQLRGLTARPKEPATEPASEPVADQNSEPAPADPTATQEPKGAVSAPNEALFSAPAAVTSAVNLTRRADRGVIFPGQQGLHSAYDDVKRIDLKLIVTEQNFRVETLTDPETGKSKRASMADVGPKRSKLTWDAVATVIQLVVVFAIPVNRLMKMIGHKAFSSGRMCSLMQWVARQLVPVYIFLAESLADLSHLSGDDTKTKVMDLTDCMDEDDPLSELDERFGFQSPYANGKGEKKAVNISLVSGRVLPSEPRSTIHVFHTHIGNFGNFLTKILESRNKKAGPLTLQGDLSSGNLPSVTTREVVEIVLAGCGAHARRPFWRYREDDPALCFYLLSCFFALARIEHRIDELGRTPETTLRLRRKYARKIWNLILARCRAAVEGGVTSAGRAIKWPPKTKLNAAAWYVIDNFQALTRYIDDHQLEYTNNARERGLRAEVVMLVASKFRKTRRGRAALDVLRTISACCTAADISLADYLHAVLPAAQKIQAHPDHYTP